MPEEPLLDPGIAPDAWERVVRRIMAAAGPELARRRRKAAAEGGLLLDRWARPLLAAAAALILLAGGELAWNVVLRGPGAGSASSGTVEMSEAPGLEDALFPPVVARWIGGDGSMQPTVEEIAFAPVDAGGSR